MKQPTLRNKVAKAFYLKAIDEFSGISETNDFLPIECRGYWKGSDGWTAFDNVGNELFIEDFDQKQEAIKYANGELAVTKSGIAI